VTVTANLSGVKIGGEEDLLLESGEELGIVQ